MKQLISLLFIIIIFVLVSSSCSNVKTYAQQLEEEQTVISAYIKRNNINVLTTFPTTEWKENDYVKTGSGMYFHLVDSGDTSNKKDTLEIKNIIVPRYYQYTLTEVTDTITRDWNTIDFPYPADFVYGDLTQSCKAFHEAATYMKHNNSQAKIIVPFLIGFDPNNSTPYGYTLKIKYQK